ncbi:DUF4198 domain-containing protein [Thiohalorhabdus methylotrophus]|uniref:DUF4198 domain-containing protein n=1 Tax=Thiohalorhabdus methylotrophus TaxID=3242694 RepID=A0ABV4TWT9_9GAMM
MKRGSARIARQGLLALLMAQAAPASGHELWLEPVDGDLALQRGHRDGGHQGDKRVTYEPSLVKAVRCWKPAEGARSVDFEAEWPVRVPGNCAALLVRTGSGFWTQTASGLRNIPATEAGEPLEAWRSVESLKRLSTAGRLPDGPISEGLELVPETDPRTLSVGEKWTLRLYFRGEPLGGAEVTNDGRVVGVTRKNGAINVRLRQAGAQRFGAAHAVPFDGPEAERTEYRTVLTFTAGAGE